MVDFKIYQKYAQKSVLSKANSVAKINSNGQYEGAGVVIDDAAAPSSGVLYTAEKVSDLNADKADLKIPAAAGNLAKIDVAGQYQDSGLKVNDASAPSSGVLYTSQKVAGLNAIKADLKIPAAAGNLAKIDAAGQYQDSGLKVDDASAPSSGVLYTSVRPKVFMFVSLNSIALPLTSAIPLTGTADYDPFSIWNGSSKAIIPRNGTYFITAVVRVGPTAQAAADRWIQLEAFADARYLTCNRFTTGSAIAGVGDNDSIFLQISTVSILTQGEQVGLSITNAIGLAKQVNSNLSHFKIAEL